MICMDKHHCFLPMLLASVIKCHVYCIALYVIFKDRPIWLFGSLYQYCTDILAIHGQIANMSITDISKIV